LNREVAEKQELLEKFTPGEKLLQIHTTRVPSLRGEKYVQKGILLERRINVYVLPRTKKCTERRRSFGHPKRINGTCGEFAYDCPSSELSSNNNILTGDVYIINPKVIYYKTFIIIFV